MTCDVQMFVQEQHKTMPGMDGIEVQLGACELGVVGV
jgi:hypothetical protein